MLRTLNLVRAVLVLVAAATSVSAALGAKPPQAPPVVAEKAPAPKVAAKPPQAPPVQPDCACACTKEKNCGKYTCPVNGGSSPCKCCKDGKCPGAPAVATADDHLKMEYPDLRAKIAAEGGVAIVYVGMPPNDRNNCLWAHVGATAEWPAGIYSLYQTAPGQTTWTRVAEAPAPVPFPGQSVTASTTQGTSAESAGTLKTHTRPLESWETGLTYTPVYGLGAGTRGGTATLPPPDNCVGGT